MCSEDIILCTASIITRNKTGIKAYRGYKFTADNFTIDEKIFDVINNGLIGFLPNFSQCVWLTRVVVDENSRVLKEFR